MTRNLRSPLFGLNMLRKLFVCPWFGPLPPWFDRYLEHIEKLKPLGYDWLITTDLDDFSKRVKDRLGLDCPIVPGTGKLHDYRASLGVLYEEEIRGYDYWGHTDFDCCYGRIDQFMPDEKLSAWDIWSNHVDYICGPWTLYKTTPFLAELFTRYDRWREILSDPTGTGWVEFQDGFTGVVDAAHDAHELQRLYTFWQTKNLDDFSSLRLDGDVLYENDQEVMMAHFRRRKIWPLC